VVVESLPSFIAHSAIIVDFLKHVNNVLAKPTTETDKGMDI